MKNSYTSLHQTQSLLNLVKEKLEDLSALRISGPSRINILRVLGLQRSELDISKLLAALLDPAGSHDQGPRILTSFLRLNGFHPDHYARDADVLVEYPIRPYGQLDILIRSGDKLVVCIENKVYAGDQENQIGRYLTWLRSRHVGAALKAVVYLTPSGRDPYGCTPDPLLKTLSYGRLADWIRELSAPPRLKAVCEMFAEVCDEIARGDKLPMDDLTNFLAKPENIAAALQVGGRFEMLKQEILREFWRNVQRFVDQFLVSLQVNGTWRFQMSTSQFYIVPRKYPEKFGDARVVAVAVYAPNAETSYGIWKSSGPFDPSELTPLFDTLRAAKFPESGYRDWLGWKRATVLGLPDHNGSVEGLLRLSRDNLDIANPLAQALADELNNLFAACRESLEKINGIE